MINRHPVPVTKASLALSKKHARQTIATDKVRIREHATLAKKQRSNKRAYKEEMWHVRDHRKNLKSERQYLKSLNKLRIGAGRGQ